MQNSAPAGRGLLHSGHEFTTLRGIFFIPPFCFEKVKGTDMVLIAPTDSKIIPIINNRLEIKNNP